MKVIRLLLLLLMPLPVVAQQWITTASGVRARAAATATADEIARLPIGTLLTQLDNEKREATVGNRKDFWYHVSLPNQKANPKDGWVFGAFLKRFDAARKGEIYREIAAAKAKVETGTYAEFADLARFIATVSGEVSERSLQAELELWRWIAIHRALGNIPMDKLEQPEYQRFIKSVEPHITYSDPAGAWFVQTDVLWNLHKKYADLPVAETIAWEAANLPMPGECEGDELCITTAFNASLGRYMKLYPKGKHVSEALGQLIEYYQEVKRQLGNTAVPQSQSAEDIRWRREARAAIAQMRSNVAQVTNPKKEKFLALLAQYEKSYQAKP